MWDFAGALLGFLGTQDTNATNVQLASQNSAFNAEQAQINRSFQAGQQERAFDQAIWGTKYAHDINQGGIEAQEDWQAQMSNTAWQRGTKDMEAAGLNPMLAYSQGPASSPIGANAPVGAPAVHMAGGAQATGTPGHVDNPFYSAAQVAQVGSQLESMRAEREKLSAETRNVDADTLVKLALAPKTEQDTKTGIATAAQLDALAAQIRELTETQRQRNVEGLGAFEGRKMGEDYQLSRQRRESVDAVMQGNDKAGFKLSPEIANQVLEGKLLGVRRALGEQQQKINEPEEWRSGTWVGKHLLPWLPGVGTAANSAAALKILMGM